jgi:hypothetical protein
MKQWFKYSGYVLGIVLLLVMIFPHLFLPAGVSCAFALAIFTQVCTKNVSGSSRILIADKASVTAVTITSNEITAITGSNAFMRIDTVQDSVQWKQDGAQVGLYNWKITNTIDFDVMPPSKTTSVLLQALLDGLPCGFLAIIADSNGLCWLVGHNATDILNRPLRTAKQTNDTGKGIGVSGGNQITIELTNDCSGLAIPFTSGISATIIAGTEATFCKWS